MQIVADSDARGTRLVADRLYDAGETIHSFAEARLVETASRYSIQVSATEHAEDLGVIANLNHSCDPNVVVDVERREVRALRLISPGEELAFFYPSTEWNMAAPFECSCGSSACLRWIAGAHSVDAAVLARYDLAPHVRAALATS